MDRIFFFTYSLLLHRNFTIPYLRSSILYSLSFYFRSVRLFHAKSIKVPVGIRDFDETEVWYKMFLDVWIILKWVMKSVDFVSKFLTKMCL